MFGKRKGRALDGRVVSSSSFSSAKHLENERNLAIVNFIISHVGQDQRPYLEISIFGFRILGLLDSGATRSIIGREGWEILKGMDFSLDKSDAPSCTVADGKECMSQGSVTVPVRLMDQIKLIKFLVVPEVTSSIILGIDFWCTMGIVPDLKRDVWNFTGLATLNVQNTMTSDLTDEQRLRLQMMLNENWERMPNKIGCTSRVQHKIVTESEPVKQRYYPVSPAIQVHIDAELKKMLADNIIEPSSSAWSSPILMVPKKDGGYRFCVDFRRLNKVTKKDAYPLPYVSGILDRLRGAKYLSSLDIKSAYWQIPMSACSREFTAFTIPGRGLFQFKRMPFGLTNAPATWQRLIDEVLQADLEPFVFVYLDDVIVISESFEQHLEILQKIFDRLFKAGLTLNRDKCQFFRSELRYLGYVVDKRGLRVDPDKVNAILGIPTPSSVADVRSFLGMASWYRRFVKDFATISNPLTNLLKKNRKWHWTEECQESFQRLKECLISAPVLNCPDFSQPFVVQTDASGYGLGAVLTQVNSDGERVICFLSRSLTKHERNYSTTERECLSVVWAIQKLRPYLEGSRFTVVTDHASLTWLINLKDPSGRLCRWAVKLQQYDFEVIHRKGKEHVVPDCLSRSVPKIDNIHLTVAQLPTTDRWYSKMKQKVIENKSRKFSTWKIHNDSLYKHVRPRNPSLTDEEVAWKRVIPKDQRQEILKLVHDLPTSGHPGITKTYNKLKQKYYWPKMKADVVAYVNGCIICAEHKVVQKSPPGLMGTRPRVFRPFQLISTDLIGPLPPSAKGYKYILVVCDYFSKFVLTFPLRAATAPAISRFMEEYVFLLFGAPQYIICDNGVQFRSGEFRNVCAKYDVAILFNALYHPQNNPTERVNRVIKTMLSSYIKDRQQQWFHYLPSVTCAIRNLVHEATGLTPYFVNFGREQILSGRDYPVDAIDGRGDITFDREEVREQRPARFVKIYAEVRKRLDQAQTQARARYNLRRRPMVYHEGQQVWRKNFKLSSAADNFASKLAAKYVGPFKIRKKISDVTYELEDVSGKERGIWHVKDLKPGPIDNDDEKVSNKDL